MKYALINMCKVLRVKDNPLLEKCINNGFIPIPIYCFDDNYFLNDNCSELSTGIPRMLGPKFDWLIECLTDCKLHLQEYGLDLLILLGGTSKVTKLIDKLKELNNEITCYSLAYPDEYEIKTNKELIEICKTKNIPFNFITGYSTFVNVFEMFPTQKQLPIYKNRFKESCHKYIKEGKAIISSTSYTINPWPNELHNILHKDIKEGLKLIYNTPILYKNGINIREDILGFESNVRLENKAKECLNRIFKEGGILTHNSFKLQSGTMLSPLINHGVIAPYYMFNECLKTYQEVILNKGCDTLKDKYKDLIDKMLIGAYGICISNIERNNIYTLNSSIFNKTINLSLYKSIEESKELVNTLNINQDGLVNTDNVNAVIALLKILMNKGYVSNRIRLAIGLCLNACKIHPYVIRDIFRGFLIDYNSFNTYVGLCWIIGTSGFDNPTDKNPISINKQLVKNEYGLTKNNELNETVKDKWYKNKINYLSVPFILESNRLPIRPI